MTNLKHSPLFMMTLAIDFAAMIVIGKTPVGLRRIVPVTGGSFVGDRLSGIVLPGADWVINRADGVMQIDVRLVLKSEDGALIYLRYQGRFLAEPDVMARFGKGAALDPSEYSLSVVATIECGDDRYGWLNNVIAVGTGTQVPGGAVYDFYEIG